MYGQSKEVAENLESLYFCISRDSKDLAIAQVLIKKIPFIGSVMRINRGPLLIEGDSGEVFLDSLDLLIKECRRRKALMIQIAPETPNSPQTKDRLKKLGLSQLSSIPWSSGLLDLQRDEEAILMSLNGKWRNCYRKGLKLGVRVEDVSYTEVGINNLLNNYKSLQLEKEFNGLSSKLVETMANKDHKYWRFNVFEARDEDNQTLGNLVSVNHGDTSIYLIGTTTLEGRKLQANYVMLWEAIINAKKNGCIWFDIGGLTEETPSGIAHFKKGLNAEMYSLTGEWRGFFIPKIF